MALVSLDGDAITEWAAKQGLADKSFAEIARDEKTRELISGYIETLNSQLNRWEQIKRFAIIDRELSVAAGDLTPSMKLRRNVALENFADTIADLYRLNFGHGSPLTHRDSLPQKLFSHRHPQCRQCLAAHLRNASRHGRFVQNRHRPPPITRSLETQQ